MPEQMGFEDRSGEGTGAVVEIPKELRTLRTQAYDKSVSDLVEMMRTNDLVLDPDYQRNYVWDKQRASLLIESIILNVPIPVVYIAEAEDSRWVVVDGLQRLNTLRRFFANEFKLTQLEVLPELNKLQYSTLNPKAQRILKNGIIRIILILKESHPEIKYDIFQRLNRGSVKLNEQELRNCLFRGSFNVMLKKLRENPLFLECMGLAAPHWRSYDAELILRYFAISDAFDFSTGKLVGYPNKMKTFLNDYMEAHRQISAEESVAFENRFTETIAKVYAVFGKGAFRRIDPNGYRDKRVNRALMDVIMTSFDRLSTEQVTDRKDDILGLYKALPAEDTQFFDAILYGTSDTKKIEYRISTWTAKLGEMLAS